MKNLLQSVTMHRRQPDFTTARHAANSILARPEFRIVGSQSWFDRIAAEFYSWLNRVFSATEEFGHRSPWLGLVLEWSFVGLTVLCILIWVARTMQSQRVAVSLSGLSQSAHWHTESADWADRARAEAEASNWREAIHCLYWASIVLSRAIVYGAAILRVHARVPGPAPAQLLRQLTYEQAYPHISAGSGMASGKPPARITSRRSLSLRAVQTHMKPVNRDRKLVLLFSGVVFLLIAAASLLTPPNNDSDKSPTTYNSGTAGIKAAYLLLGDLGYTTARWLQPPSQLGAQDVSHTTLIFANPNVPVDQIEATRTSIADFLRRGGRVLVTGPEAANLLPDAATSPSTQPFEKLCLTTPEGRGPLARAGKVAIDDHTRWNTLSPAVHVEQWCGADAVVVSYRVGKGTAVWWSSALPLTNLGLKDDPSLKLFLASVDGPATGIPTPKIALNPTPAYFSTNTSTVSRPPCSTLRAASLLPRSPARSLPLGFCLSSPTAVEAGQSACSLACRAPRRSSLQSPWASSTARPAPPRQPPNVRACACFASSRSAAAFPVPSPNGTLLPSPKRSIQATPETGPGSPSTLARPPKPSTNLSLRAAHSL